MSLTIHELAERTGLTVRSIRYYQTRGLIPSPRVEGRTGYYDERHLDRLALIEELQEEGLNLRAIGFLLGGAESVTSDELRSLKHAVLDGWINEEPEEISTDELLARLNLDEADDAIVSRAVDLGLVEPIDADRWRVLTPTNVRAGGELHALGVSPTQALDVLELLREQTRTIALAFIEMFDEAVVARFDEHGRPFEEWPELRAAVDRLRPIAGESLLAVFHQVMREVVSEYVASYLDDVAPDE